MKKNKNKTGYLILITGLSGSGKTTIAGKILNRIKKKLGPTILINGDDLRKIFKIKGYDTKSRKDTAISYAKLAKFITDQKINVILATVSMFHEVRKLNRKNLKKKYIEIYIEAPIKKIISNKKKKIYFSKKLIVGKQVKAEFPTNPDIKITNDFTDTLNNISDKIIKRIFKK